MRKTIVSAAVGAAFAVPGIAAAQSQAPAPGPVTANIGLVSDYRFRGLSQTMKRPALQGGFDYSHSSGFYLGNWNSNVSSAIYPNSNLEMDFYGGYKPTFGDITGDFGFLYYYSPGSRAAITNLQTGSTCTDCTIDNKEIYAGASWKWLSAKLYWSIDDFFGIPDTKNSWYLDFTGSFDLGNGLGIVGHVGRQKVKDFSDASYSDWKLGVTRTFATGWSIVLAWLDTNADRSFYTNPHGTYQGRATGLLTIAKAF